MNRAEAYSAIIHIVLTHYPSAQGIYRFGTFGTENEWPDSDVDIAVLLPPEQAGNEKNLVLSQCRFDLEAALSKPVDLLNARQVSTVFQVQIVGGGELIHCADRNAVDEFEMLVLSYYQKLNDERRGILEAFKRTKSSAIKSRSFSVVSNARVRNMGPIPMVSRKITQYRTRRY